MATIPITSLAPSTTPPADKSIRGIVTLSWPYSSSTRQCALLLADPDFRLRNRKGQVRVRFTGASAEAVARSRVGIGDEVVLSLDGASWEEDTEASRTPGKSVDGELFFRRKLSLKVVRERGDVEVNVDAPASPPARSPVKSGQELATPLPKGVGRLRDGLDGVVESPPSYTYTSPAFVKRLRLSGESFLDSAYDPFTGDAIDLQNGDDRPRTSFGSNLRWRLASTTPSPTKEAFQEVEKSPVRNETMQSPTRKRADGAKMLPPPLPQLQVPSTMSPSKTAEKLMEEEGPSTPKLKPVNSPTLPLPLPFPTDTTQIPFAGPLGSTRALVPSRQRGDDAEVDWDESEQHAVVTQQQEELDRDEEQQFSDQSAMFEDTTMQEYLSDTEEDTEPDEEEDSEPIPVIPDGVTAEEDVQDKADEEILDMKPDEEPRDQTLVASDEITAEGNSVVQQDHNKELFHEPSPIFHEIAETELPAPPQTSHLLPDEPRTPTVAKEPPSDFSLDGVTSAPVSEHVTPLSSEKDRVMAQTFRSLFGFGRASGVTNEASKEQEPEQQEEEVESTMGRDGGLAEMPGAPELEGPTPEDDMPVVPELRDEVPEPASPTFEDGMLEMSQPPQLGSTAPKVGISEMERERLEYADTKAKESQQPIISRTEEEEAAAAPQSEESPVAEPDVPPSQSMQQPPPSSIPRSQLDNFELGSSSDEEEDEEDEVQDEGQTLEDEALDDAFLDVNEVQPQKDEALDDGVLDDEGLGDAALADDLALEKDARMEEGAIQKDETPEVAAPQIAALEDAPPDYEAVEHVASGDEAPEDATLGDVALDDEAAETAALDHRTPENAALQHAASEYETPEEPTPEELNLDDQTPTASQTIGRSWFESPEIQDSLEDTETEDLMDSNRRSSDSAPGHAQQGEIRTGPLEEAISFLSSSYALERQASASRTPQETQEVAKADGIKQHSPSLRVAAANTNRSQMRESSPVSSPPANIMAPLSTLSDDQMIVEQETEPTKLKAPPTSLQARATGSNLSQTEAASPESFSHAKDTAPPIASDDDIMVVEGETERTELETPPPTATPTVIDLVSSSPVEQTATSPFEGRSDDVLEDFIEQDKLGYAESTLRSDAEEESQAKSLTLDEEVIEEHPSAESQEQEVQAQALDIQRPSYPSLPITPSNSQSLQDMPSQAVLEIPQTSHSMLPPTPQLTQVESFTQLQEHVEEEPPPTEQEGLSDAASSQEPAEEEPVPVVEVRKPTRKSLSSRVSNVPDVISEWFSPRRSSAVVAESNGEKQHDAERETPEVMQQMNGAAHAVTNGHAPTHLEKVHTNGFSTALSYFTPLSRLEEFLNPSSQQLYGTTAVDIFAVVTDKTKEPVRAKAGPRDYFTIFRVSDSSLSAQTSIRVEVFRPWMATLPVAQEGDVILLRGFVVKSRKRQVYLLSTDASAWCVWRYEDASTAPHDSDKPVWARKRGNGDGPAKREEIKGPPVELGDEEREHARHLRLWWELLGREAETHEVLDANDDVGMNGHVARPVTAKL